jgi:hypothetical protein
MLGYSQSNSRPDIASAVSSAARFTHHPRRSHEDALKRIGRYLKGTLEEGQIAPSGLSLLMSLRPISSCSWTWQYAPNGRARCRFQSNLSPEMIVFGDIDSLTPVFWGKKLNIRTACNTIYMVMINEILLKGRLCRSARHRSLITRIRRSISGTWSPIAARTSFGDAGISSRQNCNGANSLSPWIVVVIKPRLR